jgi:putative inorganic carbon (hco3(-)) transporter
MQDVRVHRWRSGAGWVAVIGVGLLVGALPIQWAAATVAGAAIVVLALARPELGLGVLAISVPFSNFGDFNVGGFPLTATELLVGLMFLCGMAVAGSRGRLRPGALLWPISLFVGVILLSIAVTSDKTAAVKEMLRWAEVLAAYLVTTTVIENNRQRRWFLVLILIAGAAVSLVGWAQFFLRLGPEGFRVGPFLRAYGTFGQPNPFGGYLGMVLPLAISLAILWQDKGEDHYKNAAEKSPPLWVPDISSDQLRKLAWVTMTLAGIAMLMSMSRGSWLGAFVAISLILILRGRRSALALGGAVLLGLLILTAGAFNLLPQAIASRLFTAISYFGVFDVRYVTVTPDNWPVVERMAQWQSAWGMFQDYYYLGVGAGNYSGAYPAYSFPDWPKSLGHAHNYYLNTLAEMGIVGLGAYLIMAGSWLWLAGRRVIGWRRRLPGSENWAVSVGLLGVFLAVAVHSFFDNLYVHGMNVHIGLILGLVAIGGESLVE